jgi:hypothetical protein
MFFVFSITLQFATLDAKFRRACSQLLRTGLVRVQVVVMILTDSSALRASRLDTITQAVQTLISTLMVVLETCRMSLVWVSPNAIWTLMVQLNILDTTNLLKRLLNLVGVLHLRTTTSNTNSLISPLLPQASRTTTHTHILALTNKGTKFPIMVELPMEHLLLDLLSSSAASTMLSHLALRRLDNMEVMTSNIKAKVLHLTMAKDNHLDTTKEAAIEVE